MILGHGGNVYALARQLGCELGDIVDMSSNINPLGPPSGLIEALRQRLGAIERLPQADGRMATEAVAKLLGLDPARVMAGNGTTQLIHLTCHALGSEKVLIVGPTYSDYADACRASGIDPNYLLPDTAKHFRMDAQVLCEAIDHHDTVFICNPNNPTGTVIDAGSLIDICQCNPRIRFVIDESYLPFVPQGISHSLAKCRLENVVVLWSASKIFAVPGLRAGFLIAAGRVLERFRQYMQPWSMNGLAQEAMAHLSDNASAVHHFIRKTRAYVEQENQRFVQRMASCCGTTVFESVAPFTLLHLPDTVTARSVCEAMGHQRILIRDCSNFHGLSDRYIRISLKNTHENRRAAEVLSQILEQLPPASRSTGGISRPTPRLTKQVG